MTTLTTILNHVKVDQIEGDMHKNIEKKIKQDPRVLMSIVTLEEHVKEESAGA